MFEIKNAPAEAGVLGKPIGAGALISAHIAGIQTFLFTFHIPKVKIKAEIRLGGHAMGILLEGILMRFILLQRCCLHRRTYSFPIRMQREKNDD